MSDTLPQTMKTILRAGQSLWSAKGDRLEIEVQNWDKRGDTLTTDAVHSLQRDEVMLFANTRPEMDYSDRLFKNFALAFISTAVLGMCTNSTELLFTAATAVGLITVCLTNPKNEGEQENDNQNDRDAVTLITQNLRPRSTLTITNPLTKARIDAKNNRETKTPQDDYPLHSLRGDMMLQEGPAANSFQLHDLGQAYNKTDLPKDLTTLLRDSKYDLNLRYVARPNGTVQLHVYARDHTR